MLYRETHVLLDELAEAVVAGKRRQYVEITGHRATAHHPTISEMRKLPLPRLELFNDFRLRLAKTGAFAPATPTKKVIAQNETGNKACPNWQCWCRFQVLRAFSFGRF